MDTVVGNKYLDVFNNLDIEVSKKLEGVYTVDEIIKSFSNFFFNRMFLDITSIKDYKDISNLKELSMSIDMDKVILLLDKDDAISKSDNFLSKLVSMGIYNFTSDSDSLMYLYNNPNTYRDVAHYQDIDNSDSLNKENNVSENAISQPISNSKKKIIGIKNITDHAGATSFSYLIKKALDSYYSTLLIEIDRMDLTFFNDGGTLSIKDNDLVNVIDKYDSVDVFIIDLNKSKHEDLCTDILYLIEPSVIKINKLSYINPGIFNEIRDKKIILNKILLENKDVSNFEAESNLKVFYNIGNINDREDNTSLFLPLLSKLGYVELENDVQEEVSVKKSIFDIFRK